MMKNAGCRTKSQLLDEIEQLRSRLCEAEQTLHAIRFGEVDALVVEGPQGERVFSLTGAEHIYRVIAETMNEAALTVNLDGTILFCNRRFCDLMKIRLNEAIGRKVMVFVSPPQVQTLEKLLSDVQAGPVQRRLALRALDGTAVPAQLSGSPIEEDALTSICLLVSDLTEIEASAKSIRILREQQQALEESEHRFRAIFESSQDAVVIANDEGTCVQVNPATHGFFGLSPEQIIGRHISEFVCSAFDDPSDWQAYLTSGVFKGETLFTGADGRVRHMDCNAVANIMNDRHLFVLRDITERKRAEQAMRESEAQRKVAEAIEVERRRLFDVLETLPAMICLLTPDYHVAFSNRAFREKFGDSGGRHCYEYCFGFTRPCDFCQTYKVLETGEPHLWEVTAPDGGVIEAYDFPFTDVDGSPMILEMDIDITERRKFESELIIHREHLEEQVKNRTSGLEAANAQLQVEIKERRQAEEALRESEQRYKSLSAELELRVRDRTAELERKNRELQEFSFVASHDLNEPLRKIQTFGSLLKLKSADRLDEQAKDYVSRMTGAAGRMQELLDALLRYSRVDTKGQEFRPTNLGDIVQDTISDLEVGIRGLEAHVEIGPLPTVNGDPYLLRQLLQNLIANSIKYHRPEVRTVIKVHAEENNGRYRISVEDNGIGFDEKYLHKIFQPFQRLHGRDEYSGTGIGLAICRKVVDRHGGTITARSTLGKGSTFIVTLPVTRSHRP